MVLKMKYIVVIKHIKDLYDKNFNSLKKEVEEDIRRWNAVSCSRIDRINIENLAILPKANYRFNVIPIKIPPHLFTDPER